MGCRDVGWGPQLPLGADVLATCLPMNDDRIYWWGTKRLTFLVLLPPLFWFFFSYDRMFGPGRFGLDLDLIWFRCVGSGLNPTTCSDLVSDLTQSPGILLLCIIYLIIWYMIFIYLCIIFSDKYSHTHLLASLERKMSHNCTSSELKIYSSGLHIWTHNQTNYYWLCPKQSACLSFLSWVQIG